MATPADYLFAKTHEWAKFDGASAQIGVSDFAQNELGDLVFVNLPEIGDEVKAGDSFADVESVKAVSDVYSPVSGKVTAVNQAIIDDPSLINSDPYGSWFIAVDTDGDKGDLLDAAAYDAFCANEA